MTPNPQCDIQDIGHRNSLDAFLKDVRFRILDIAQEIPFPIGIANHYFGDPSLPKILNVPMLGIWWVNGPTFDQLYTLTAACFGRHLAGKPFLLKPLLFLPNGSADYTNPHQAFCEVRYIDPELPGESPRGVTGVCFLRDYDWLAYSIAERISRVDQSIQQPLTITAANHVCPPAGFIVDNASSFENDDGRWEPRIFKPAIKLNDNRRIASRQCSDSFNASVHDVLCSKLLDFPIDSLKSIEQTCLPAKGVNNLGGRHIELDSGISCFAFDLQFDEALPIMLDDCLAVWGYQEGLPPGITEPKQIADQALRADLTNQDSSHRNVHDELFYEEAAYYWAKDCKMPLQAVLQFLKDDSLMARLDQPAVGLNALTYRTSCIYQELLEPPRTMETVVLKRLVGGDDLEALDLRESAAKFTKAMTSLLVHASAGTASIEDVPVLMRRAINSKQEIIETTRAINLIAQVEDNNTLQKQEFLSQLEDMRILQTVMQNRYTFNEWKLLLSPIVVAMGIESCND